MATKKFKCKVCGYIHEGDAAPAKCPVCGAPASEFEEIVEAGAGDAGAKKGGLFSDKNSNAYIILYSTVMVVIVAVLLSLAALSLQKRQYANELGEKKNNILQSLGVPDGDFDAMVKAYVVDAAGNKTVRASEIVGALKPVVRVATEADIRKNEQNKQLEEGAWAVWAENVKKNGLVMQLVDVEYTFDNSKLIFYFTADGRVDFRELVKDLAGIYRTRIELRQIGVRDEAKLVGGIGVCGRPFCCKSFLSDFAQVSIKMAKEQNLSLSSAKISGACGRLMCCLRFEHEVYEKEYASFPKADTLVSTPAGRGVIIESSFLSGKIKVRLEGDANSPARVYTKDEIKILGQPRRREQKAPVDDELKKLEDK